jgi:hypothetical protein
VVNSYGVNAYDLVFHDTIVLTTKAAGELAEILDPKREKSNAMKEAA